MPGSFRKALLLWAAIVDYHLHGLRNVFGVKLHDAIRATSFPARQRKLVMPDGVPQLPTLMEVATLLRCSTDEVMRLVEEGRLNLVRLFPKYRFRSDEVKRLIDSGAFPPEGGIST